MKNETTAPGNPGAVFIFFVFTTSYPLFPNPYPAFAFLKGGASSVYCSVVFLFTRMYIIHQMPSSHTLTRRWRNVHNEGD